MTSQFKSPFSKKYIIVVLLSTTIFLIGSLAFLLKAPSISEEAYGEHYTIGGAKVSTIGAVLGENRKVSNMILSTSGSEEYKKFTYSQATSIKSDIRVFVDYLTQNEGFAILSEENPDSLTRQTTLSKWDTDTGVNILVEISCEVNSYIITLTTG